MNIDELQAGPDLDKLIAVKIFGFTGIGYYGPPLGGLWEHKLSIRYDTKEQAIEAYRQYWTKTHGDNPRGYMDPDENDPGLCHWKDGWGPLTVYDYSTCIWDAWKIVEKLGPCVDISSFIDGKTWQCSFLLHDKSARAEASTPALAICLAALKCIGEK